MQKGSSFGPHGVCTAPRRKGPLEGARLRVLKAGLALILTFVGAKMLLSPVVTVPPAASLGVIGGALAVTVGTSLLLPAPASARVPGGVRER